MSMFPVNQNFRGIVKWEEQPTLKNIPFMQKAVYVYYMFDKEIVWEDTD